MVLGQIGSKLWFPWQQKAPHWLILGKMMSSPFLGCFWFDPFLILTGNNDMHKISDEFEFRPDRTTDYGVSCPWASKKFSHTLIMGKWCLYASSFIFDRIIINVAGNQDRHKSSGDFDFGPLVSMAHLYVFWNERLSSSACGWSKDLFFQYLFDSGEQSLPFGLLVRIRPVARSAIVPSLITWH